MAVFNIGDWVKVGLTPDSKWRGWSDVHDDWVGSCGIISEIVEDPFGREGDDTVKIEVDFAEEKYAAGHTLYYLWFLKKHLSASSPAAAKTWQDKRLIGAELQEWERFKRKAVDDGLNRVFGIKPKIVVKAVPLDTDWEEATEPSMPIHVIELDDDDDNDWTGLFSKP
ncbi:MAG TPA: hypothetical protein VMW36_05365 [Patescibacteria group bacterium]|nr:hypothetical protein [Patescibacteria group bacterium]